MRFNKKISYITAITALSVLLGCSTTEEELQSNCTDIISVQIPGYSSQTRVGVAKIENLDLHFSWNSIDKLHFFAFQNLDGFHFKDLGDSYAMNISEDGTSCEFSVERPSAFDKVAPYSVYGVTGCSSTVFEGKVYIYTYLQRTTLASFSAPFWVLANVGFNFPAVEAKHIGAYELLHIKNTSSQKVVFKLVGYEANQKWYYDNAAFIPETGEVRNNMAPVQSTIVPGMDAIAAIVPNESATLISWYIPNGNKLVNATMVASIDGVEVRSKNRKSSNANLQVGHAYHMYATWDGTNLTFNKGDVLSSETGVAVNDIPGEDL